jgi:hypothetical protein
LQNVATALELSVRVNLHPLKGKPMKKSIQSEMDDELRPEYDLRELLKGGVRGKYVERYRAGTNLILLDPDVARAFSSDQAVNEALRLVIKLNRILKAKEQATK